MPSFLARILRWLTMRDVFVLDEDGTAYVIHARPLTDKEKKRNRRRSK